jgi:hypothetical protein
MSRSTAILLAATAALAMAPAANARGSCDRQCLLALADQTMTAIAAKDYRSLPWADPTRYTEENVALMIGDAWWGSAGDKVGHKAFAFADPETGNVVWIGTIWDHDAPGYGVVRINAPDGKIKGIEVIAARKPLPVPFGDPTQFSIPASMTAPVAASDRRPRQRLVDIADAYLSTKQGDNGTLFADFTPNCTMEENGVQITSAEVDYTPKATDCASVFKEGLFAPVEHIRDRRFPLVDPGRGLVLAIGVQDLPAHGTSMFTTGGKKVALKRDYPMSRLVAELIRIEGDKVVRSEAVVTSLPYLMPTPWK